MASKAAQTRWAFIMLVLQNSSVNILSKISRTASSKQSLYVPSTLVCTTEFCKLVFCFLAAIRERRLRPKDAERSVTLLDSARAVLRDLFWIRRSEMLQMATPSLLYAAVNNLSVSLAV